jgi:hypothetical protein
MIFTFIKMKILTVIICLLNRLQDEYHSLEEEIRRTIEESKIVQEKYKSMYEDSRREVADKQSMLEDLRNKVKICSNCHFQAWKFRDL